MTILSRIIAEQSTSPRLAPAREEDWSLDALGNWSGYVQKASGTTDLDQSRAVNRVNEITDISETTGPSWITSSYDKNGNMSVAPHPLFFPA